MQQITRRADSARAHPRPTAEASKAQSAASPPATERESKAETGQAEVMGAAKPGVFDKAAFVASVKAAIAAQAPQNLEQADDFATSGKADAVATEVGGAVGARRDAASRRITEATAATPDASSVSERPAVPLAPRPTPAGAPVDAKGAAPGPAPTAATDLSAGARETDAAMAEADVTPEQLAKGNEPEFDAALAAKREGEEHSATAPGAARDSEQATLANARAGATTVSKDGIAGLDAAAARASSQLASGQVVGKSAAETARASVVSHIRGIFAATRSEVTDRLAALDASVSQTFATQEKAARTAFTTEHRTEMDKYKEARYAGVSGKLAWIADKVGRMPPEANQIFVRAKAHYEERLSAVISQIADHVGSELTWAKERIARGRADIASYVEQQPRDLAKSARETAGQLEASFDALESDVDSKRDGLVDDLAAKYVEARSSVDQEITAAQEANKGLWDRAKEAVGGAITTVLKLKAMLQSVLARAVGAIGKIIADPIGFLGNLVGAVKGGILGFGQRIGTYLKNGLSAWLFGALGEAGITLPKTFDLKGVLTLVMSILGLSWASIRARIAAKLPSGAIETVESKMPLIALLVTEGPGGIWKLVLERVGDIKAMIMSQIEDLVSVEIIKAGIVWLVSMLNPASAFVKACKMIVDVVMFFVEKAGQIKALVDAVLNSVESIAAGGVGAVAGLVENALAKMVPVLIGFLASLLGLGGISGKIKKIIESVQKPVGKAVDWVITKAVTFGKKAIALGSKMLGKIKKGAGRLWDKTKKKLGIRPKTPDEILKAKQKRLDKGLSAGVRAVNRFAGKPVQGTLLKPLLAVIRLRYRMAALEPVKTGDHWSVYGRVNPDDTKPAEAKTSAHDKAEVQELAARATVLRNAAVVQLALRRAPLDARGTARALKASRRMTIAIAGSAVREQGGGEKRVAQRNAASALRYAEAERIQSKILAEVQKEIWLRDPQATPLSLGAMMRDPAMMDDVRQRMSALGVYVPMDGPNDRKAVGETNATHAEKLAYHASGESSAIGIAGRPMCAEDCQPYFTALGKQGKLIVVNDGMIRVFTREGQLSLKEALES